MMRHECKHAGTARGGTDVHTERGAPARPRSRWWCAGGLVAALLVAAAPATASSLAGRIWMPAQERFVEPSRVLRAARAAHFVLLGETHTVARHHRLQARFIRAVGADRRSPVVLEMLPRNLQPVIDEWRSAPAPDPAAFGNATGWADRGWPPWAQYRPIVDAALARDLPIHAGAPAEAMLAEVADGGLGALARDHGLPGLDRPLPAPAGQRLLATLRRAHCGLPEHAPVDRMIAVQRLRDASMAGRLVEVDGGDGAILVAGHGHVRGDYGVPRYLERAVTGHDYVSIAFFGTVGTPTVAAQREAAGGTLPFDFVWFTPGGRAAPECAADDDGD